VRDALRQRRRGAQQRGSRGAQRWQCRAGADAGGEPPAAGEGGAGRGGASSEWARLLLTLPLELSAIGAKTEAHWLQRRNRSRWWRGNSKLRVRAPRAALRTRPVQACAGPVAQPLFLRRGLPTRAPCSPFRPTPLATQAVESPVSVCAGLDKELTSPCRFAAARTPGPHLPTAAESASQRSSTPAKRPACLAAARLRVQRSALQPPGAGCTRVARRPRASGTRAAPRRLRAPAQALKPSAHGMRELA